MRQNVIYFNLLLAGMFSVGIFDISADTTDNAKMCKDLCSIDSDCCSNKCIIENDMSNGICSKLSINENSGKNLIRKERQSISFEKFEMDLSKGRKNKNKKPKIRTKKPKIVKPKGKRTTMNPVKGKLKRKTTKNTLGGKRVRKTTMKPVIGKLKSKSTKKPKGQVSNKAKFGEFSKAVTSSGYKNPNKNQYQAFIKNLGKGLIKTKREAAMFLAHILWESGGLKFKKEIACAKTGCPGVYDNSVGVPGKNYYGRGYIQLTHSYNYKAASQDLYGDDRLIRNPDLVSDKEDISWATAFWFWKVNVHSKPGISQGHFGVATRAINSMECTGQMPARLKRFEIYKKVLIAFNIKAKAISTGC